MPFRRGERIAVVAGEEEIGRLPDRRGIVASTSSLSSPLSPAASRRIPAVAGAGSAASAAATAAASSGLSGIACRDRASASPAPERRSSRRRRGKPRPRSCAGCSGDLQREGNRQGDRLVIARPFENAVVMALGRREVESRPSDVACSPRRRWSAARRRRPDRASRSSSRASDRSPAMP